MLIKKQSSDWTEEQEALFRKLYAIGSEESLREAFPDMTRSQMKTLARRMNVARLQKDRCKRKDVEQVIDLGISPMDVTLICNRAVLKAKYLFHSKEVKDPRVLKREPVKALIGEASRILGFPEFIKREALSLIETDLISSLPGHRPMAAALVLSHVLRSNLDTSETLKVAVVLGLSPFSLESKFSSLKPVFSSLVTKIQKNNVSYSPQELPKKLIGEVI